MPVPLRIRAGWAGRRSLLATLGTAALCAVATPACAAPSSLTQSFDLPGAAMQNVHGGTWLVSGGSLNLINPAVSGATASAANLSVDPAVLTGSSWEYTLTATSLPVGTGRVGFSAVFGYRDAGNYYDVTFSNGAADTPEGVYRVAGGVRTRLVGFAAPVVANRRYALQVRSDGSTVKVYLDGGYVAKVGQKIPATGQFGVASSGAGGRYDDLEVHPRATTVTSTPVGTPAQTPTPTPTPKPTPTPTPTGAAGPVVAVRSSAALTAALAVAVPGEVIELADGVYSGGVQVGSVSAQFAVTRSGTAAAPITVRGSRGAVVSGSSLSSGYGLYLAGVHDVRIEGLTVTGTAKGIVADGANHDVISGVQVTGVGDEGIHLRSNSSDNVVRDNVVTRTGLQQPGYGEGLYVGSAKSNWSKYSAGAPDASDRNALVGNTISATGAENIDIKEGSTGGVVSGNVLDGAGMSGRNYADSLIDVKGNGYRITGNTGTGGLLDAFQVHSVATGWGVGNVFTANTLTVGAGGFGVRVQRARSATDVGCDNTVTGAGELSNQACTPDPAGG